MSKFPEMTNTAIDFARRAAQNRLRGQQTSHGSHCLLNRLCWEPRAVVRADMRTPASQSASQAQYSGVPRLENHFPHLHLGQGSSNTTYCSYPAHGTRYSGSHRATACQTTRCRDCFDYGALVCTLSLQQDSPRLCTLLISPASRHFASNTHHSRGSRLVTDCHPRHKQQPKAMPFSSKTGYNLKLPSLHKITPGCVYTYIQRKSKMNTNTKNKTAKRKQPSKGRAKTPWSWCICRVAEPSPAHAIRQ